jgi:hypothetical protein
LLTAVSPKPSNPVFSLLGESHPAGFPIAGCISSVAANRHALHREGRPVKRLEANPVSRFAILGTTAAKEDSSPRARSMKQKRRPPGKNKGTTKWNPALGREKRESKSMPVIARFSGIVIRLLCLRAIGARLHAFAGDQEIVLSLWPLRIVSGDAPASVRRQVLDWATRHQQELLSARNRLERGQVVRPIAA